MVNMKFQRLIENHSKKYNITHKQEGHWDGPNWVEGEKVEYEITAAIFPLTAEEVDRYEGLGYTTQDIKIFIPAPGGEVEAYNLKEEEYEHITLREDDEITYQGNDYVLDSLNDRTTHADFVKWIAVRAQGRDDDD